MATSLSLLLLLIKFYLLITFSVADDVCDDVGIDSLFSYPINNVSDPLTQEIISNAVQSLSSNHFYFKIDNFLSEYGLSQLQQLIVSDEFQSKTIRRSLQKTVFGEKVDYINFPNDTTNNNIHPRNRFVNVNLLTVGARQLPSIMVDMFEYEPLLNILKDIVIKSGKYNNLYLSNDTDGSVYVFLYNNGNYGEWHYDQHPFTCVYLIHKPDIGGRYLYYFDINTDKHDYNNWEWNMVDQILRNETSVVEENVHSIEANEGDMYCHTGNITLHRSEHSFNNNHEQNEIVRSILVLSYADRDGFVHDECRVANDACDNL